MRKVLPKRRLFSGQLLVMAWKGDMGVTQLQFPLSACLSVLLPAIFLCSFPFQYVLCCKSSSSIFFSSSVFFSSYYYHIFFYLEAFIIFHCVSTIINTTSFTAVIIIIITFLLRFSGGNISSLQRRHNWFLFQETLVATYHNTRTRCIQSRYIIAPHTPLTAYTVAPKQCIFVMFTRLNRRQQGVA